MRREKEGSVTGKKEESLILRGSEGGEINNTEDVWKGQKETFL